MKVLPKVLLALTAVAALSVACPAKANLITNGGFETGDFTDWTVSGVATVNGTVNGIAPHSGIFQANMLLVGLTQSVATTPGASYTIDFFVASNNFGHPSSVTLAVNWGGTTIFSHLFTSDIGYTEYTFTETASASSTDLEFFVSGVNGAFVLDDVSVNAVGTVPDGGTTVSLLGCALLGLAGLRRRLGC